MPASELDRRVLHVLACAQTPMGAYEIIEALRDVRKTVAATPVYRALKRLLERGEIERIETLSAYRIRKMEKGIHCICKVCGKILTVPVPPAVDALEAAVRATGFVPQRFAVEATGHCAHCEMTNEGRDS
ncbi:MAG: transcriptional repressor [Novosphingobium sp.]